MVQSVGPTKTLRRVCSVPQNGWLGSHRIHTDIGVLLRMSCSLIAQNVVVLNARTTATKSTSTGSVEAVQVGTISISLRTCQVACTDPVASPADDSPPVTLQCSLDMAGS